MQENTNKSIAINSIIMYVKMGISTICSLLTTRFALLALGISDFGLFSVLGGIISLINIFNTIMLSTSNRFLSVAVGKGNSSEINKIFNVNLSIFLLIALIVLLFAFPIGHWYIHNYLSYAGDINNAKMVFDISIIGSVISSVGIPYNGLLIAKEKFIVFSSVDILTHIVKLAVAYLLIYFFDSKLLIYTITLALMTALPTFVNAFYCKSRYPEYVSFRIIKDKKEYYQVLNFSGWVAYGAIATVGKQQGAALLVNVFFSTVMNAALGIATSINAYILLFTYGITQPIAPQITKSYAIGNSERTNDLLVMSSKAAFLITLLVSLPFLVSCNWILSIWLREVPAYAVSFTLLLIIDSIINSFNQGISNLLFASGKIKLYQLLINTLRIFAIIVAYYVLKAGHEPYFLFVTYIFFSLLIVVCTQWVLHHTLHYDNMILIRRSYIPSFTILFLLMPLVLLRYLDSPFINIVVAETYAILIVFNVALSKTEKLYVLKKVGNIFKRR
jgi:O-antigen/teichoic acid export membrane protein